MRFLLLIALSLIINQAFAQGQCACDSNPGLKEHISCDTLILRNKAKLYWQFNCDSSWLTFQSRHGRRTVLYSLDDVLEELTGRLGYSYATEYKTTFLIRNDVISGCCDPAEYILFDKETGKLRKHLGRLIFYNDNPKQPSVVYLADYNTLVVLNVDTRHVHKIYLPKGRIKKALEDDGVERFAENLFNISVKGNILTLSYHYGRMSTQGSRPSSKIIIDLEKYSKE